MKKIKFVAAFLAVALFVVGSAFKGAVIADQGYITNYPSTISGHELTHKMVEVVPSSLVDWSCEQGQKACRIDVVNGTLIPAADPDGAGPKVVYEFTNANVPTLTGSQEFVF